ncbi:MAG: aminomethyltransferase family protein, partial [Bacteroidota bacterium]
QTGDDAFRMISGTALHSHDMSWLREHLPADGSVTLKDITAELTCFGIWGPDTRELLQPLVGQDLTTASMPFLSMRSTAISGIPVQLVRVTFVGELGYEIYAPWEQGKKLWELLWNAGKPFGMVACGYKAIDSLRAEKGYVYWGSDISPDETPMESGLGFAVSKTKDFLGKEAMLARPIHKKLVTIVLDDPRAVVLNNEPVRVNGNLVGRCTSGAFGSSLGWSIAFAYLPAGLSSPETDVEILVFGDWIPGKVKQGPLYDPKGLRVRS